MPVTRVLFHSADTYWMPIICRALCQAVEPGMNQIPAHHREGVEETDSKAGEPEMNACRERREALKTPAQALEAGAQGAWTPGLPKEAAALPVRFSFLGLHQNFCL